MPLHRHAAASPAFERGRAAWPEVRSRLAQLAEVTEAAHCLTQAAHGALLALLRPQYNSQKTEPEASVTNSCLPVPLFTDVKDILPLVFVLFCGSMRWEVGISF